MITLFENITEKLTDTEKEKMVPVVVDALKCTDEHTTITGEGIRMLLKYQGFNTNGGRIRIMINYIRQLNKVKPWVVIGANNGYFITTSEKVIEAQIESLLGRIDSMKAIVESIKAQKENLKHC